MITAARNYLVFLRRSARIAFVGDWRYYAWMGALTGVTLLGVNAYAKQLVHGLVVTGMSDEVSWGVYIANFTFLVGVAAAAVMMVIPVYIYDNEELHDLVIFGELLAVAAIIMCLLFVTVDLGRPDRFWHLIPGIGQMNFPKSMLSWDVIVLNGYLLLNVHICGYLLYCRYQDRKPAKWFYIPFVFTAIVWAVSIHTVTAFLYVGLGGRPFWNASIVGPRFLASAFTAGPAIIILALQVIRHVTHYRITDKALLTLRSIVQVSMIINVFLLVCEVFKEFYSGTTHGASAQYLFFGLHGHHALVPWIWTAIAFNLIAMVILLLPVSRGLKYLNVACGLSIVGIWIEKGMGLVIPGFIPTPLGAIVDYSPSVNETLVCLGIWAFGLLCYTIFLRMSVPILQGRLSKANEGLPEIQGDEPEAPLPEPATR
ncbi:sulfate reduction electron transfer complex DsrMKJOP subunit DsrP [Opitutus sp. GAS368]|uniref:sulfate reduction electron transfer complex DsrMKJOP subunit DsrP n=1 Tax=Opitutus sp. GAS368 TaxID=1882749 RepID=UPI000879A389|nr:NrfD/PsrC family molybdoenzyme membrane anchor subunit [Opitutus sp. GAS368]SDS43681.1 prokaryotic molybdopterin-containing oxidoreductase family, membrane subunit [Opitutus sp. GAS368]